jgi:hypothetical protein
LSARRSQIGRSGGVLRSENVGMSSNRTVSKPSHRMAEVSAATIIVGGLVGPKPRPKGVGDGQTVDSPLPLADEQVRPACGLSSHPHSVGDAVSKRATRVLDWTAGEAWETHFGGDGW